MKVIGALLFIYFNSSATNKVVVELDSIAACIKTAAEVERFNSGFNGVTRTVCVPKYGTKPSKRIGK